MKPKRLSRTVVYENAWVNLYIDKVRFPDGRIIDQHHLLDFEREAVAVLIENSQHQLLLVHAYRYTADTVRWELPAGLVEKGESILAAARREVLEESGYESTGHELVYSYYPMGGIATQLFHIMQGKVGDRTGDFDRNEVKEIRWVDRSEIERMVRERSLTDGFSLTALLLYLWGSL